MLLITLFLFVGCLPALEESDFPLNFVTEWDAAMNGSLVLGWNLTGSVVYEQAWPGAEQRLKFVTSLSRPRTNWVN